MEAEIWYWIFVVIMMPVWVPAALTALGMLLFTVFLILLLIIAFIAGLLELAVKGKQAGINKVVFHIRRKQQKEQENSNEQE